MSSHGLSVMQMGQSLRWLKPDSSLSTKQAAWKVMFHINRYKELASPVSNLPAAEYLLVHGDSMWLVLGCQPQPVSEQHAPAGFHA